MNRDRLALTILAGIALIVLGGIAAGAILKDNVPDANQGLLGAIAAGLLLFSREVVTTIRAAWTDERTGALTDQLASSAPASEKPDRTTVEGTTP